MACIYTNPDTARCDLADEERLLRYRSRLYDILFGSNSEILTALDTETTGPDFFRGSKPYYVSIFDSHDNLLDYQWAVDPFTRASAPPPEKAISLQAMLEEPDRFWVFHNRKFDSRALLSVGITPPEMDDCCDTMIMSHVVNSLESHGLKDCALKYLDIGDNDEYELKLVVEEARAQAKKLGWDLAKKKHPHFPALSKAEWWKMDMWVPEELAKILDLPADHPYRTVTPRYGRMDVIRTLGLARVYVDAIEEENLWEQYWEKYKLLSAIDRMEEYGVSMHKEILVEEHEKFEKAIEEQSKKICAYSPTIKKANSNVQLSTVLYEEMDTPIYGVGKSGKGSTSKETLAKLWEEYSNNPQENPISFPAIRLIDDIRLHRKLTKSDEALVTYINSGVEEDDYFGIFSDCNPVGTKTTRLSFKSPSIQVISKGGGWETFAGGWRDGFNLRRMFGPARGRVWWAPDYSNIEMRIFAYESGDPDLIAAFERGESVHIIFASLIYPKEYQWCLKNGKDFKRHFKATLYQYVKNGNFSLIYGAGEAKADATYHKRGAYQLIRLSMPYIDRFMDDKYREAVKTGFVRLLGGYRLRVPLSEPHKAVNYFVQGSAGWAIMRAINKLHDYLLTLHDHYLIMQIHDELVFDFPNDLQLPAGHPTGIEVMRQVIRIMEESGTELGFPLPVETDIITSHWSDGKDMTKELSQSLSLAV